MLLSELDVHVEAEVEAEPENRRNGTSKKTTLVGMSQRALDIPRDRSGTFDPNLIA